MQSLLAELSGYYDKNPNIWLDLRYDNILSHWRTSGLTHFCFSFIQSKSYDGQTPLMEAASISALRISKAILEKVKDEKKILNEILSAEDKNELLPINHAIRASHKNSERCAKIIISYYGDDSDAEQIFLPCLQLGDMKLAQKLWDRTKGDDSLQKRMMETEDKDGYNCFLLVCKNGQYDCLKWLLSLNDAADEEADEDEKVCSEIVL